MSSTKINIFSWGNNLPVNTHFKNINQTIVVDPRNKTPKELAENTRDEIERLSPNIIALRFWKEVTIGDVYAFDTSDPVNLLKSNGVSDILWKYWRDYFFHLEKLNITPDIIIHDLESGFGYWNIKNEAEREIFFRTIFNKSEELSDILPEEFLNISYDSFMENVESRIRFHRWANMKKSSMLQRVFHNILFYIYGTEIPHSNYKDLNMVDDVINEHNRALTSNSITSISSPAVYFDNRVMGGSGRRYKNLEKHPRWNRIIESMNTIISCLKSGGEVIPWIAPPGYGRYGPNTWTTIDHLHSEIMLWDSVMRLMTSMGISNFILWNPSERRWNPHAEKLDIIMDSYAAYIRRDTNVDPFTLNYINDDVDEIRIGNTVIKYEDIVNHMG